MYKLSMNNIYIFMYMLIINNMYMLFVNTISAEKTEEAAEWRTGQTLQTRWGAIIDRLMGLAANVSGTVVVVVSVVASMVVSVVVLMVVYW